MAPPSFITPVLFYVPAVLTGYWWWILVYTIPACVSFAIYHGVSVAPLSDLADRYFTVLLRIIIVCTSVTCGVVLNRHMTKKWAGRPMAWVQVLQKSIGYSRKRSNKDALVMISNITYGFVFACFVWFGAYEGLETAILYPKVGSTGRETIMSMEHHFLDGGLLLLLLVSWVIGLAFVWYYSAEPRLQKDFAGPFRWLWVFPALPILAIFAMTFAFRWIPGFVQLDGDDYIVQFINVGAVAIFTAVAYAIAWTMRSGKKDCYRKIPVGIQSTHCVITPEEAPTCPVRPQCPEGCVVQD